MQRAETMQGLEQEAWHGISNPVAQQVVREVFRHLSESALQLYSWSKYRASGFQQRVRDELERSGLAQKIAAGTAELPLIYDYMPRELKPLDWRSQIETPGALAVHVMRNLEWYLLPPAPVRLVRAGEWLRRHGISLLLLAATIAILLTGVLTRNSGAVLVGQTQLSANAALIVAVPLLLLAVIVFSLEFLREGDSYDTRCAEFFRYLVNTYADQEDSGGADRQPAPRLKGRGL